MDKCGYYLRRTLQEQTLARNSTTTEARRHHEDLAIAYELRCLSGVRKTSKAS